MQAVQEPCLRSAPVLAGLVQPFFLSPQPGPQVTKMERKCAAYREELRSLQAMHDGLQSEHTAGGRGDGGSWAPATPADKGLSVASLFPLLAERRRRSGHTSFTAVQLPGC